MAGYHTSALPRYPACHPKIQHASREAAERHVERMPNAEELHSYRCPACGWFHVGHVVPAARRAA
jgi:uncharacterized protein with PIN domain